ncbi:Protein kinase domain-containing protein [Trichoderma simmonsii]|uniref:Protein kinase domain-containing protein n=1 Tax=Trichoderma simmonsii TaxID=1491479 RepID=A0A8G0KZ81_9HYPO|nr:Protein kinase domain-containing protein [Trichoderma simmonsii]
MLPLMPKADPELFQNWGSAEIEVFCERQYTFIAPVFDFTTMQHFEWDTLVRMPFLKPLKWGNRGAHGQVAKVKIHPQHQAWKTPLNPGSQTSWFAVKKFIAHDDEGVAIFNKERAALLKFSKENNGHKHLIKLLLSYQIEDSLYMIFPWADGNLAEFWEEYPSKPSENDSFWLIHQCFGLSDGLSKIHGYNQRLPRYGHEEGTTDMDAANRGRHGDIKPENILFFHEPESDRGHLVVSDFTLMRFHSDNTIHKTAANDVSYSKAYCPPEVHQGSNTFIDQKYDIWSLGCVYLEFITWYLQGYDAIRGRYFKTSSGKQAESFQTMRRKEHGGSNDTYFSHVPGPLPKVKTSVDKWLSILHKHEHCSQAIHDFLSLIDHHMLAPLPNDRYSMNQVRDELHMIASKCRRDSNYCQSGIPMGTLMRGLNHLVERSGMSSFQPVGEHSTTIEQGLREVLRGQATWNTV